MIVKADMTCIEKREFLHYAVDYVESSGPEHLVAVKFASNLLRESFEDETTMILVKDMADDFELGEDYTVEVHPVSR